MKVLQIGSDRSKRGILVPRSPGYVRQKAYAERFGALDIIGYSLRSDGFTRHTDGALRTFPTNSWAKLLCGTNALLIALRLGKPDVVSAQDPHQSGLLALWIARWRGVPLHIQMHADIFSPSFAKHSLGNYIRQRISRYVLARADGIRVVSHRIKASVEARLTPKRSIAVLPIFVDIAALREAMPNPALTSRFPRLSTRLLFVGRLEAEKNPMLALRAFADSAPADTCLIIVGDGKERAALEEYARERGVASRVFFEGERDAAPYYGIADLVLVTSVYEGYGLVTIEALAAGKPVLSTDVGIAGEAGAIVATAEQFSEALAVWFTAGPRAGEIKNYPYADFADYVGKYCDDIQSVV